MPTQIQGYDFKFMYKPGPELVLADTPSRFPNVYTGSKSGQFHDRQHRDGLATCRSSKTTSVKGGNDPRYRTESTWPIIYTGWPDKLQDLPGEIRDYWSYREELVMENGVIFKGRQVLVPPVLQGDILVQLHSGHQGIEKTRQGKCFLARINKDRDFVQKV